jgi:hypothetical protein
VTGLPLILAIGAKGLDIGNLSPIVKSGNVCKKAIWQLHDRIWRTIEVPKAVLIGNPPENKDWIGPVPVEPLRLRKKNTLVLECINHANGGINAFASLVDYHLAFPDILRFHFDFRDMLSKQNMLMNDHIEGWRLPGISESKGRDNWFAFDRTTNAVTAGIGQPEIKYGYERSLIYLKLGFNGLEGFGRILRGLNGSTSLLPTIEGLNPEKMV